MRTIEEAYELADQYADKTDGYTSVRTQRMKIMLTDDEHKIYLEYIFTAQAITKVQSFTNIESLVEFLEGLLND